MTPRVFIVTHIGVNGGTNIINLGNLHLISSTRPSTAFEMRGNIITLLVEKENDIIKGVRARKNTLKILCK